MKETYLSLGSNIQPEKNIPAAIELLRKQFAGIRFSSIYETDPVGPTGHNKFWNLAASFRTAENWKVLIAKLRNIEATLGRVRSENKYAPRTLDIDILPQPGYETQAFIMIPLAEIAPAGIDSETGLSFQELAERLKEEAGGVRIIKQK